MTELLSLHHPTHNLKKIPVLCIRKPGTSSMLRQGSGKWLDIGVEPEEILWIVFGFDWNQATIIFPIRIGQDVGWTGHIAVEIEIHLSAGLLLHFIKEIPCPLDILFVILILRPHGINAQQETCTAITESSSFCRNTTDGPLEILIPSLI